MGSTVKLGLSWETQLVKDYFNSDNYLNSDNFGNFHNNPSPMQEATLRIIQHYFYFVSEDPMYMV